MLQRNAIEDRFMSVTLPGRQHDIVSRTTTIITLQLPPNWLSEFIGFLVSCYNHRWNDECVVVIKHVMPMDSEPDHDHWEEFDKNPESFEHAQVGYVPFSSLRHTSWWNPAYTHISFQIEGKDNCKVGLVPKKTKIGDSRERPKATLDRSECWEDEYTFTKTFEIIDDSNSSKISIRWCL